MGHKVRNKLTKEGIGIILHLSDGRRGKRGKCSIAMEIKMT